MQFRLPLLVHDPRARLLMVAAERGRWGRNRPGVAQGFAMTVWAGGFAAMVVEVSMRAKMPKVHRVAAVDCGTAGNPDIVIQQAQGATNCGLSAALTGKITIQAGRVEQKQLLRLHRAAHGRCSVDRGARRPQP